MLNPIMIFIKKSTSLLFGAYYVNQINLYQLLK